MGSLYVLGDIHGNYERVLALLRSARLINTNGSWIGGDARLWHTGDFFDRGPRGVECVELFMRLQMEAAASGGYVNSLLGNHDIMLLAAYQFPDARSGGPGGTFYSDWIENGGIAAELDLLRATHIEWLISLPALARVDRWLFGHADALFYREYGRSVEAVNAHFRGVLHGRDTAAWENFLAAFNARFAFFGRNGARYARDFLAYFGGEQFVHGHTPINKMLNTEPEKVREAYQYADGLCINVDGGMYRNGPGFVHRLL